MPKVPQVRKTVASQWGRSQLEMKVVVPVVTEPLAAELVQKEHPLAKSVAS